MNYNNFDEILLTAGYPADIPLSHAVLKENNPAGHVFTVYDREEAFEFIFCKVKNEYREIYIYPKVILLNVKLPKVDVIEVLRKAWADERTKYFPAAVLKSSKVKQDIIGTYIPGMFSYKVKSVQFKKSIQDIIEYRKFYE